ncbi:MAG TPA: HEAT repeat domain-containing protein, partial [Gammaproteobacteria bacterium]|nr:HEAT repeat domain-containing protein [Gammaproteobacteria bacterium]
MTAGLYFVLAWDPGDIRAKPQAPAPISEVEVQVLSPTPEAPAMAGSPQGRANRATPPIDAGPVSAKPLDSGQDSAGDSTADAQWPLLLYPELAGIVESEALPADSAVGGLLPMLDDSDPVIRLAALEALGDMGRDAPLPALTAALGDPSPQIRVAALEALTMRRDAAAVGSIEASVFDPDPQVRLAAIDALAAIEDRSSVAVLGALLGDSDPAVRHGAIAALGDIGGIRAHRYLEQMRFDPDESIRASVGDILAE